MYILSDELAAQGVRISESGRVSYPEKYSAYAARFGKTVRAVRDWVAHGKRVGALPPLHDPAALVTWWRSYKKSRVPQSILDECSQTPAVDDPRLKTGSVTGKISEDDDEKERVSRHREIGDGDELEGAAESLRQARELANTAYHNLQTALRDKDSGAAEMWRKDWTSAVETQRKWEKDFNRIQEDRGLLVRKSAVQVEIASVANTLQRGFLSSMVAILGNHCPGMPEPDRRRAAIKERDRCFEVLQFGGFADTLFPELA